jgi:hypothetical protein
MKAIGRSIDTVVSDLYSGSDGGPSVVQEPEITSRICQRMEDRLDGQRLGDYVIRVRAQSMPDRGQRSLERITGADLFLTISLEGPDGFDKGVFVQTKYDRNINREELVDACDRMRQYGGAEGSYVWIYEPSGVKVFSANEISKMHGNSIAGLHSRSASGFTGRILDCYAGSQAWGIPMGPERRQEIERRFRQIRAQNALDLALKKVR